MRVERRSICSSRGPYGRYAAGNRPILIIRFSYGDYPMLELDFMPEAGYRQL